MANSKSKKFIGYWMSEKKIQRMNWTDFSNVAREQGFDLVKLDLNKSLEEQGPFTVIIHKLTDIIGEAEKNDEKAVSMLRNIEQYITSHPEVVIIDPIENVRKLLDRYKSYQIISGSSLHNIDVLTPPFVELTSSDINSNFSALQEAGVKFPFVCKPTVANGTDCHKMAVVFNEAGLKDCQPPCVAHTFVNHNALLYKLFIVGEEYHVAERPSLKNFHPDPSQPTIHFHSHDVSKPDSSSSLSLLDEDDVHIQKADVGKLREIVRTLREELGMNLMGVDVVVENTTGRHFIIDMNAYPGYDGYPDFFDSLMRCIKVVLDEKIKKQDVSAPLFPNDQDDSGFETADSSDEKKKRASPVLGPKNKDRNL